MYEQSSKWTSNVIKVVISVEQKILKAVSHCKEHFLILKDSPFFVEWGAEIRLNSFRFFIMVSWHCKFYSLFEIRECTTRNSRSIISSKLMRTCKYVRKPIKRQGRNESNFIDELVIIIVWDDCLLRISFVCLRTHC